MTPGAGPVFDKLADVLAAWPLLLVGVVVLGIGATLAYRSGDAADARAALMAVGAVLIGAGIVRVIVHHRHHDELDP